MSHPDPLYDPADDFRCPFCEGIRGRCVTCDECQECVIVGTETIRPEDRATFCPTCWASYQDGPQDDDWLENQPTYPKHHPGIDPQGVK